MVVVVGSTNVDTIARVSSFPTDGETVKATSMDQFLGGKGANQAIGVSRLGIDCAFVSCIGEDWAGEYAGTRFSEETVFFYPQKDSQPTGQSMIMVDQDGMNRIVILPGANGRLSVDAVKAASSIIEQASIMLLQGEIPWETNEYLLREYCGRIITILDPAPASVEMLDTLSLATFVTPNEQEFRLLAQHQTDCSDDLLRVTREFQKKIGTNLIVKLGSQGSVLASEEGVILIPPFSFGIPVDTTGAGDSYNAGLAAGIDKGKSVLDSVICAAVSASICVTRKGTSSSLPFENEVNRFLMSKPVALFRDSAIKSKGRSMV
jgi:ribokinase